MGMVIGTGMGMGNGIALRPANMGMGMGFWPTREGEPVSRAWERELGHKAAIQGTIPYDAVAALAAAMPAPNQKATPRPRPLSQILCTPNPPNLICAFWRMFFKEHRFLLKCGGTMPTFAGDGDAC